MSKESKNRMKYEKTEAGNYKCPMCDKTFVNNSTCSMHVTTQHKNEYNYTCQECPKKFKTKLLLKQHITNSHCEPSFECIYPDCNVKCKTKSKMKYHYVRTHMDISKMYTNTEVALFKECLTCNEKFSGTNITNHVSSCNYNSPFWNGLLCGECIVYKPKERIITSKTSFQ